MPLSVVLVLALVAFVVGVLSAPWLRLWLNGAEQEIALLESRARALRAKLAGG